MAANSLLDRLRGAKAQSIGQSINASTADQQRRTQELLRAKTGRDVSGQISGPQASNIQEQLAAQQGREQAVSVAQQEDLQMEGLQQEELFREQEFQQQQDVLTEQNVALMQNYVSRASAIMQGFINEGRQLDLSKKKAQVEQLGFSLRMRNAKYLQDLKQSAAKNRLDNALKFKEELQKDVFAAERDLLENDLMFRRLASADDREHELAMAKFSIEDALRVSEARAAAANTAALYQAGADVMEAGVEAGIAYDSYRPEQPKEPAKEA